MSLWLPFGAVLLFFLSLQYASDLPEFPLAKSQLSKYNVRGVSP